MYTYSFSKLMRAISSQVQDLRAKLGVNPASTHTAGIAGNGRTEGVATLAVSRVASHSSMVYTSFDTPKIQHKGRKLQFAK